MAVSRTDPRLQQTGIPDATVDLTLDPSTLRPIRVGTTITDEHGRFSIEVDQAGAGFLEYEAGVLCHVNGYGTVYQTLPLPTRQLTKLSPAALETLSIIAYEQPILRARIEAIRGVASGEVIRGLMDRHMVKIVGRAEELGRPMLYGTTRAFLEVFGLADLKDLPKLEDLKPKG